MLGRQQARIYTYYGPLLFETLQETWTETLQVLNNNAPE